MVKSRGKIEIETYHIKRLSITGGVNIVIGN